MCEIDRAAIPQMCGSNLQPELVQKALPLKGLMQCQNLWHQGQPLFLPHQSYKSWISFPHYSFLFFFYWIHQQGRNEMWDVNETFSLEGRRILGQRWGPELIRANDIPTDCFSFFFSYTFPSCHSLWYVASWWKSALCQGHHISRKT